MRFNGFPIRKAREVLNQIQNKSEQKFRNYVNDKRQEIAEYHLENNSFYRSMVSKADPKVWSSIPIMTKRDLQKPLADRLSAGFTYKKSI